MDAMNDLFSFQRSRALQQALREREGLAPLELQAKQRAMEAQAIQDAEIARSTAQTARNAPLGEALSRGNAMGADLGAANVMNDPVLGSQMRQSLYDPNAPQPTRDMGGEYDNTPKPNSDQWVREQLRGMMEANRGMPVESLRKINEGAPALRSQENVTAAQGQTSRDVAKIAASAQEYSADQALAAARGRDVAFDTRTQKQDTNKFLRDTGVTATMANTGVQGAINKAYSLMSDEKLSSYGATGGLKAYAAAIADLTLQMTNAKQLKDSDVQGAVQMGIDPSKITAAYAEMERQAQVAYEELLKRHTQERAYLNKSTVGQIGQRVNAMFGHTGDIGPQDATGGNR